MKEKQFALKIKEKLKRDNQLFSEEQDFIDVSIGIPLHDLKDMNIETIKQECEKIGIYMLYANETNTNKKENLKSWKKCPSVIFTYDKNL